MVVNKVWLFIVYVGESEVKVVGIVFDVCYDLGEVVVVVKEGIVVMIGRLNMVVVMLYVGDCV